MGQRFRRSSISGGIWSSKPFFLACWTNMDELRLARVAAGNPVVVGIIVGNEGLMFERYSMPQLREATDSLHASSREHHTAGPYPDVITRKDYFVGIAAKGLGRLDVTVQPTWYSSRVSIDPTQYHSQFRIAGNVLLRIVHEERAPAIPRFRFLGMPVAFIQFVVPVHWDVPRTDFTAFESRSVGGELWAKFFTGQKISVTVLGVVGYSRDWFPLLNRNLTSAASA
jgi:hypothetical protein